MSSDLKSKLRDAEAAYHNLMTGKAPKVIVDQNGERVEYNTASAPRLAQYIQELKRLLGTGPGVPTGPMSIYL
jgi:gpW